MMEENIISIRKRDIQMADDAFAEFMRITESALNDKAKDTPKEFSSLSSSMLERVSVQCMKDICVNTPFRAEEIRLVSGQSFPDIIAETFYGVEVKSTQADRWLSTGSSILESTRDKNVESVYLLFGKLGGKPEVRCRPYEECLYDITVTHSPRYLIDMNLEHDDTIFSKMGVSYKELRTSDNSIANVRKYYRNKAKSENKKEMPWWFEEIGDSSKNGMMIRHISSLTPDERKKLIMQLYILFPDDVIKGNYIDPAMWLVSYHKVVCHNMRDFMSAGGKARYLNGNILPQPLPAIVKRFLENANLIKTEIYSLLPEIDVYNHELLNRKDPFFAWVEQVDELLKNEYGEQIHFAEWVINDDRLYVYRN